VQANASFFLEKHTRRMALRMLAKGRIHLLGSDCHDLNERKPNLGEAVKVIQRKFGPDIIPYINSHEEEILGME
jgi:protein-tyrosine phosphatase